MKKRSRNYARRQLTWMRKIPNLHTIDRTDRSDAECAEIAARLATDDLPPMGVNSRRANRLAA